MRCQKLLIIFALIVLQGHHGWARFSQKPHAQDFDMLLLTQTWLPAVCKTPQGRYLSYFCEISGAYDHWSIHGLWPHKRNGGTPEYCAGTPLNDDKIATLQKDLQKNWIDVFAVNGRELHKMRDFWEKQWKKHGTCAFKPTDKTAQFDYFKRTLYLFNHYNIDEILKRANIVYGKEYTYNELISKIEQQVHKEVQIACHVDQNSGVIEGMPSVQYLTEIRICFGRDFLNPTNCGKSRLPSCLRNTKIIYVAPPPLPPGYRASASTGPNEINPPTAPKTNPNGLSPRDFSFGIGLHGPADP